MKITFLGTSHGLVEKGRAFSSTMIEIGKDIYLIDAGGPISDEMINRDKKYEDVKAVFITHAHGDHIGGLYPFVNLANWYYKTSQFKVYLPEQSVINALKNLIELTDEKVDEDRIGFIRYDENAVYSDEKVKVYFVSNKHLAPRNRPSYSIVFEAEGKRVLFSGDLSNGLKTNDVPKELMEKDTDAFICELAHFGIKEIKPYIENSKTKAVYFTHVGYPVSKFDDIKALNNELKIPVKSVNDGDEIVF